MGLIKVNIQSTNSIKCEELGNEILVKKIYCDDLENSLIAVEKNQLVIIIQNDKIIDAVSEEGIYKFSNSIPPIFLTSKLDINLLQDYSSIKQLDGIYYLNINELNQNKFGTSSPVLYNDWTHLIKNTTPLSINLKCYGTYMFKIKDILLFMNKIKISNSIYLKKELCEEVRLIVQSAFKQILDELGSENYKVPYFELRNKTNETRILLNRNISINDYGIIITEFNIESLTLDEDSNRKIENYELSLNEFTQYDIPIHDIVDKL